MQLLDTHTHIQTSYDTFVSSAKAYIVRVLKTQDVSHSKAINIISIHRNFFSNIVLNLISKESQ